MTAEVLTGPRVITTQERAEALYDKWMARITAEIAEAGKKGPIDNDRMFGVLDRLTSFGDYLDARRTRRYGSILDKSTL